jgi:site-specific recombinase XerC
MMLIARTSLRVSEIRNLRLTSIVWSHGRWTVRVKVKGGRERTIPLPKEAKQAIELDGKNASAIAQRGLIYRVIQKICGGPSRNVSC